MGWFACRQTRGHEQLEWVAEQIREANGTAGVWLARPATADQERELASAMASARAAEYEVLRARAVAAVGLSGSERARAIKSLRGELRRVRRRDYFPPRERDVAVAAVEVLARDDTPPAADTPRAGAANHGGDQA